MTGDDGLSGSKLRTRHDSEHDAGMLGTTVVEAVAESAGVRPSKIETLLYDVVDPDALDSLFAPKVSGSGRDEGSLSFILHGHYVTVHADGTIDVQSELARIKADGGNVLLAGHVPDNVMADASTRLLGGRDADRTCVVVLSDHNPETAVDRLQRIDATPEQGRILNYCAEARSAASSPTPPVRHPVTNVSGSLDDLQRTIEDTLRRINFDRQGLESGELRFCFDSLRPLVEKHDDGGRFLAQCFDVVAEHSGLGHYVLPADLESDHVQAIADRFDAVAEFRIGNRGPEQRWHLQNTDFTTSWFGLDPQ